MHPCEGLRVIDLGQGYGAIPGMVLSDFGADVIKIEPPTGDRFRSMPAFRQWNRGKRSVVLDLQAPGGAAEARELIAGSDVLIENFRPGVTDRLGIGYDTLAADNPRLVHLAISGFGPWSPLADVRGYEGVVAAATGQYTIQNGYRDRGPIYDAVFKCSFGASMLGLIATLSALEDRERSGIGQRVGTTLVQSNFVYSYDGIRATDPEISRRLSLRQGRDPHNAMPGYRIARCADGQWIQSGSASGAIFDNLMRALGIDAWFEDERFRGRLDEATNAELLRLIDEAYAQRPVDEWRKILDEHDAAYATFMTTQQFLDHPQIVHNGDVVTVADPEVGPMRQLGPLVKIKGWDWTWPGPAPRLGEHTDEMVVETRAQTSQTPVQTPTPNAGPLAGVTILDLSMFAAAPGGPGLLCDLGARVIKIEPPGGDAFGKSPSELFFRVNRGKERVGINLKSPEGQKIVQELVKSADVLVHNFRPGVPARLGIDAPTLQGINDQLIYLYAASFGSTGPDAHRPAFDAVMSAMAGGEVLQAGAGNPPQQRQTTDHSALLAVAVAILLGLRVRRQTGRAPELETSMLAAAAWLFSDDFLSYDGKPDRPVPDSGQHGLGALYRLYGCSEDTWVFLAAPTDEEWGALVSALGAPDWAADLRFADAPSRRINDELLTARLQRVFASDSAAAWQERLTAVGVACVRADVTWPDALFDREAVGAPEDFVTRFTDPSFGALEQCGVPFHLSRTPARVGRMEPPGGSTRRILGDLGYDDSTIDDLVGTGVVDDGATR